MQPAPWTVVLVLIPCNPATETSEHSRLQTRSRLPSKINKKLLLGYLHPLGQKHADAKLESQS